MIIEIMEVNKEIPISLNDIIEKSMNENLEDIAPNFRRNKITNDQIERIIKSISANLRINPEVSLVGMMLLFLQGAASSGSPLTMSIEIDQGKYIEKRNIVSACNLVTGHQYIRRIAEALAPEIGKYANKNNLKGELATRINNRLKAETGENLTHIEMSYCSSFSQSISNLAEITGSERLTKLLAEDYQRNFDGKRNRSLKIDKYINAGKKKKK